MQFILYCFAPFSNYPQAINNFVFIGKLKKKRREKFFIVNFFMFIIRMKLLREKIVLLHKNYYKFT